MSSRLGTAIFLKDILDEALERMDEQRRESVNIRGDTEDKDKSVADALGTTAVLINDFKQKRNRTYQFSWDKALVSKGDSGIKLQYTHARLTSLLEKVRPEGEGDLYKVLTDRGEVLN